MLIFLGMTEIENWSSSLGTCKKKKICVNACVCVCRDDSDPFLAAEVNVLRPVSQPVDWKCGFQTIADSGPFLCYTLFII